MAACFLLLSNSFSTAALRLASCLASRSAFAASAMVRYIESNAQTALPARTTVDLSLAWELPAPAGATETELRLGVRNLFDRWSEDDPLKRRLEAPINARF